MTEYKIRNLEEVLAKYLGPDKKIEHVAATAFGQKGENYGSIMLKLEVKLKNIKDHNEEELHGVAKTIPDNEISRKIFNIQVTCKNEIAMYDTITPTLQEFQREHGVKDIIDYLPDMYGARLNLDGKNEIVDEDAVLILENLTVSGYVNVDRHIGFNLEEAELILKHLATFHAVPLAIKLKKPDVFEKKIKPYLAPFIPPDDPPPNGENKETMTTVILEIFQDSYKCIPYIPKLKRIFEGAKEASKTPPKEPFATVTHGDTWVNNIMLKFKNNKPFKLKFVDFQVCDYKSPGSDLFFFLFSSVQRRVLEESFEDLLKCYYNHFIGNLQKLDCDIRPFSYQNFLEEMRNAVHTEFVHASFMTMFIVMAKKGGSSQEFDRDQPPDFGKMKQNMSLEGKEKVRFMAQKCGQMEWL